MIKNFINTVRRFKAFTLLNVTGLTAAFLTFMVVVMQVEVELTHDTSYPDAERIFVLQHESASPVGEYSTAAPNEAAGISSEYSTMVPMPFYFNAMDVAPQIEQVAIRRFSSVVFGGERYKFESSTAQSKLFSNTNSTISRSFVDMFDMQIVEGSIGGDDDRWLMIPRSLADQHFPDGSAVGKMLAEVDGGDMMEVSAVYADFPSTSSFANEIYTNISKREAQDWGNYNYRLYVKLPADVSASNVAAQLSGYATQNKMNNKMRLLPLSELYFSADTESDDGDTEPGSSRESLMIFMFIALLIVLVAAINYLNFTTALIPTRITDINTRKIYGATNGAIRVQLIWESVMMCMVAFLIALGVLASFDTLDTFSFISTRVLVGEHILTIGLLTALLALVVGLLAGVYPAFYATSIDTSYALKGSFALSGKGRALRTILVGVQYVFAITLITMAFVMNLQYGVLSKSDLGFDRQNVITMVLSKDIGLSHASFFSELRSRPEVKDITYANSLPFFADMNMGWGREYQDKKIKFDVVNVHSSFPAFFGIEVVEGESFNASDDQKDQHSVLLFNQAAQRVYGIKAGQEVSGMAVKGILRDFNYRPLQSSIEPMALSLMGNFLDKYPQYAGGINVYVRCQSSNYAALFDFIRAKGKAIDPDWDGDIAFMDSRINELYQNEARTITQINVSSAIAILISLLGVFGLIHFDMQRRRKEIALRKINGASIGTVLLIFNRRFVWIVGVCFLIALPLSWWAATNWLASFAYRTPIYWWIFALALLVVLVVTIVTITVQSWRTASENPIHSLKSE